MNAEKPSDNNEYATTPAPQTAERRMLASLDSRKWYLEDPLAPIEGEEPKSHEMFMQYFEMGVNRSLAVLGKIAYGAEKRGDLSPLWDLSKRWQWQARIAAHTELQRKKLDDELLSVKRLRIHTILEKLDWVEAQARAAWEESKKPAETTISEQESSEDERQPDLFRPADVPASARTNKYQRKRALLKREGQCGDPRFLDTIRKCIEDQRAILGLDAAPPTVSAKHEIDIGERLDERLKGERERLLESFAQTLAGSLPVEAVRGLAQEFGVSLAALDGPNVAANKVKTEREEGADAHGNPGE